MALLVILLPARVRRLESGADAASPEAIELPWVLSPDGRQIGRQGSATLSQLPPADRLVALCPPMELAWHRLELPRAAASRLPAALAGVLEERLLDDPEQVAFALEPGARGGQTAWVATLHRPWVERWSRALAAAGRTLDALVPLLPPGRSPAVHCFAVAEDGSAASAGHGQIWAAATGEEEAICLPLSGTGSAERLAPWRTQRKVRRSATPAASDEAERALGRRVRVISEARVALAAAGRDWQLLQFDLTPQQAGMRNLSQGLQAVRSPAWRPARWGLVAVLAANLLGLNVYAWQQRQGLQAQRQAMEQLLLKSHPQVRAVLDAPVQMRRETDRLREAAGAPGEADLESALSAMARAWPPGTPAPSEWHFEGGRLTVAESALLPPQADALRQGLQGTGWVLSQDAGQWQIRRGAAAAGPAGGASR